MASRDICRRDTVSRARQFGYYTPIDFRTADGTRWPSSSRILTMQIISVSDIYHFSRTEVSKPRSNRWLDRVVYSHPFFDIAKWIKSAHRGV